MKKLINKLRSLVQVQDAPKQEQPKPQQKQESLMNNQTFKAATRNRIPGKR